MDVSAVKLRLNELGGQPHGVSGPFQDFLQYVSLRGAGYEEGHASRLVDDRRSQSDSIKSLFRYVDLGLPSLLFAQHRGMGKERSGVAGFAEAQKDQIKTRRTARKKRAQQGFVLPRGRFRGFRALDGMNPGTGDGHMGKQRALRHKGVAARVVGRYAPLIAPEEMDSLPI